MSKISRMFLVAVFGVLALGGCKKGGVESAIKDWAKKTCECKDEKCLEEMDKKEDELQKKYEADFKKLSKEKQEALEKEMSKAQECEMKIKMGM